MARASMPNMMNGVVGKQDKARDEDELEHVAPFKLHVANIPLEMEESGLRNAFSRYGRVVQHKIFPKRPEFALLAGFVVMGSAKEALVAITNINRDTKLGLKVAPFQSKIKEEYDDVAHLRRMKQENEKVEEDKFLVKRVAFDPERKVDGRAKIFKQFLVEEVAKGRVVNVVINRNEDESSSRDEEEKNEPVKVEAENGEQNGKKPLILGNPVILPHAPPEGCHMCNLLSFFRCSRCQIIWYCSPQCQKQDWKRHRDECFNALPRLELAGDISRVMGGSGAGQMIGEAVNGVGQLPSIKTTEKDLQAKCEKQEQSTVVKQRMLDKKNTNDSETNADRVNTESPVKTESMMNSWTTFCLEATEVGSSCVALIDTSNEFFSFDPKGFPATIDSERLEEMLSMPIEDLQLASKVEKGLYCLAISEEAVFRAVIIDTTDSSALAFLIDFGYNIKTTNDKIFSVPKDNELFQLSAMVVRVEPDNFDNTALERLNQIEELEIAIVDKKVVDNRLVYCKATLSDMKDKSFSTKAVISPWTAVDLRVQSAFPEILPSILLSHLRVQSPLSDETRSLVQVSFVEATDLVWVLPSVDIEKRKELELAFKRLAGRMSRSNQPKINEIVVTKWKNTESGDMLCRAQVLSWKGQEEKAKLLLIDYGAAIICQKKDLFRLPLLPIFIETPPLVTKIALAEVAHVSASSNDFKLLMKMLTPMLRVEMTVASLKSSRATLHHPSGRTLNDIIEDTFNKVKTNISSEPGRVFTDQVDFNQCDVVNLRIDPELKQKMFVTHVESANDCFIVPQDQLLMAMDMFDQIAEFGRKSFKPKARIGMGEVVIALASDQSWYRATLASKSTLFFPDFGFIEDLDTSKIRDVPRGMMKTPFLANMAYFDNLDKNLSLETMRKLLMNDGDDPVLHDVIVVKESDGLYTIRFPELEGNQNK